MLKEISKTGMFLKELEAEGKLRTVRIEDLPKMAEFNQSMAEINAEYELKNARSEMEINQKILTV
ncbi:hypothetical protein [Flavobacterium sp.]|uniref:hypothetical protein n=1 Tax=Flavobacterium sp. TaxID=239 RepID=UPI0040339222